LSDVEAQKLMHLCYAWSDCRLMRIPCEIADHFACRGDLSHCYQKRFILSTLAWQKLIRRASPASRSKFNDMVWYTDQICPAVFALKTRLICLFLFFYFTILSELTNYIPYI